jgi:signal transduction histidine kinase
MIYSVIHELANNSLKHAGAKRIDIQIIQEPDRISFNVQDDGCGFDSSAEAKGIGLQNISNRIAAYNGILNINSKIGEGTETNVELRIKN